MERASSFDNVSGVARKNVSVQELLSLCDEDWVITEIKDLGISDERDRIINSLVIQPILGCLRAGYDAKMVRDFPTWVRMILGKCDRVQDPIERIERLGITEDTELDKAVEMFKKNLSFLQLGLIRYPEAARVLEYLPEWANTDKQKIEYVKIVYRSNMADWYLNALSRMTSDDFIYLKQRLQNYDTDCLAILALRNLPREYSQFLCYSGIYWISICFGKSVFRVPVYEWEFLQSILKDELYGVDLRHKDGTIFICDPMCSSRLTPVNKYSDAKYPIEEFSTKIFKALGCTGKLNTVQVVQIYNLSCEVAEGRMDWRDVQKELIGGKDEAV